METNAWLCGMMTEKHMGLSFPVLPELKRGTVQIISLGYHQIHLALSYLGLNERCDKNTYKIRNLFAFLLKYYICHSDVPDNKRSLSKVAQ